MSKARLDFPEPESPVTTLRVLRGISTEMFFRLCWRAPRTVIRSITSLVPIAANFDTKVIFHARRGQEARQAGPRQTDFVELGGVRCWTLLFMTWNPSQLSL